MEHGCAGLREREGITASGPPSAAAGAVKPRDTVISTVLKATFGLTRIQSGDY
jgi:hypothetical protein